MLYLLRKCLNLFSNQSKTIISFAFVTGHWNLFNLHLLLRFTSYVKSDSLLKSMRLDNAAHFPLLVQVLLKLYAEVNETHGGRMFSS